MPDFDPEDDMQLYIPTNVVPCRGRDGGAPTIVCESFNTKQLDALAPLAPIDQKALGERFVPEKETIDRLEKRIEAARRLKYGR